MIVFGLFMFVVLVGFVFYPESLGETLAKIHYGYNKQMRKYQSND